MSLAEGIARYLDEVLHAGRYSPTDPYGPGDVAIVIGPTTPSPDEQIGVTIYAGAESDSRLPYDEPSVQLKVRGTADETVSQQRAADLYYALHGLGPLTLPNGVLVMSVIGAQAGPIPVGRDEVGRHEHTVNLRVDHVNPTGRRPAL